jgi:hypothetical protein
MPSKVRNDFQYRLLQVMDGGVGGGDAGGADDEGRSVRRVSDSERHLNLAFMITKDFPEKYPLRLLPFIPRKNTIRNCSSLYI